MLLPGCKSPRKTPTTNPTLEQPVQMVTAAPGELHGLPSSSPILPGTSEVAGIETQPPLPGAALVAASQTVTASPSATPCTVPSGWVIYSIQPGDTLGWLAEQTKSTVGKLKQANCLESDLIIAYESIYLPRRPPAQAAGAPGPAPSLPGGGPGPTRLPIVDCNASLSCIIQGAKLDVLAGGPGNPSSYEPCKGNGEPPRIEIHGGTINPISQGDRTFFYACNFTVSGGVIAQAIPDDGSAPINLKTYPFHPALNLDRGLAQAVIDFPVTPDTKVETYTIHVSVGTQSATPIPIEVVPSDVNQSWILPVPLVGSPGDTFQVYYVNYPVATNITSILFSAEPPGVRPSYTDMIPRLSWTFPITESLIVSGTTPAEPRGWTMMQYKFPIPAQINTYAIADLDRHGRSLLWIK